MRVLYFSPRDCWPITTGARLRDFHLAQQLALKATLTYIGFITGEPKRERLEPLANSEVVLIPREPGYAPLNLVRGLLGPTPISVLNYTSAAMMAELERLLREEAFDAIQIEGVHLFAYVKRIRELAPRARLICDWHNIESELARSLRRKCTECRTTVLCAPNHRPAAAVGRSTAGFVRCPYGLQRT